MAKLIKLTLAATVAGMTSLSAYAVENDNKQVNTSPYNFVKLSSKANFIDGKNLILNTPVDNSYSTNVAAKSLQERAADMDVVMVHRNGDMYEAKMNPEDLKIFENAIKSIEKFRGKSASALFNSAGHAPTVQPEGSASGMGLSLVRNVNGKNDSDLETKSVIGTDDRTQVTTTTVNPYYYYGRIDIGCTGTLVGKKHVLTAGHCVANGSGSWYSALDFTVAQDGSYKPWGSESWATAYTTSAWFNNGDYNNDYAMIILNDAPHGGWSGYGTYSGGTHRISGYPGDKPLGTMWTHSGSTSATSTQILYTIDTYGGNSGSGVVDTGKTVRGIHNLGGGSTNKAVRITSSVFNTIQGWIADNP